MRSRKKEGVYFMSILKRQVLFVLFAFAATLCAFAQNKTITGLVVDGNGESIIGASVLVKGTTNGIITDIDGKFTLNDVPEAGVIQISYIGYKTQEISAKNKANLKVVLVEDNEMLDEVVVVGYGVQKKSDVTGAMIRVGSEELNSRPVANAFEAMQGKAAGVDIVSNERPGEVGTINVRGVRSLSASNTPLYVVDGIPLMSNSGIETLNPQDIESIDVLKDASATAIYGSRGANGVILVTTKSGKEGKMSLNYSGTVTIENLQDYSEMMNSAEYIDWRRWSYYYLNPSKYPRGDQPTKENDYEIFLGATDPTAWKNIEKGWAGGTWDGSRVPNTDWCDMVTQTGVTHEHTLSASGGTDKMKGYASIGYLDNEGTVKGQSYTRYTTKLSLDLKPTKWFNLGLNVNGTFSEQQYGSSASSVGQLIKGMPSNLYAASTSLFPYASPYDEDGNRIEYPGGDDKVKNVMNEWNNSQNERRMFRAIGSLYAQLDLGEIYAPLKGLRYRFNFGPDFRYYRNGTFRNEESISSEGKNRASLSNQSDFSWTLDNLIYYNKTIKDHSLGLTLMQSASKYHYEMGDMTATNVASSKELWYNLHSAGSLSGFGTGLTESQMTSYMARMNYGFKDRYLLTASVRWDGSSVLAPGHKWATFPSAALAWRIDQEDFMKDINWISQLKLRLGFGVTGNAAIDPYSTKGAIQSLYYQWGSESPSIGYLPSDVSAKNPSKMANNELTWEKTTQYNVGIDYGFLNNRISGSVDVYKTKTKDLLLDMTIPSLTGYVSTLANVGKTSGWGIDLQLNAIPVQTNDFTWNTTLTWSMDRSQIDALANGNTEDVNNRWFVGEEIGVYYDYVYDGIWKTSEAEQAAKYGRKPGQIKVKDLNNDGSIDATNDRQIVGKERPRWTGGWNNTFSYKNLELSCFIITRMGFDVPQGAATLDGRYMQRKLDYWVAGSNEDAVYYSPGSNGEAADTYNSSMNYQDGSYIKVRNISLGYNFTSKQLKNTGLSNLKVYVQAMNPFSIYKACDWLDTDLLNYDNNTKTFGSATTLKSFVVGLNVGF